MPTQETSRKLSSLAGRVKNALPTRESLAAHRIDVTHPVSTSAFIHDPDNTGRQRPQEQLT